MPTNQPVWRTVYANDYSMLQEDITGVYAPELTLADSLEFPELIKVHVPNPEPDTEYFFVHRIVLDRCTWINNVLSDNKFHPDYPAWFALQIAHVAKSSGISPQRLILALTSADPKALAMGYEALVSYYGASEFDGYPTVESESELSERFSKV